MRCLSMSQPFVKIMAIWILALMAQGCQNDGATATDAEPDAESDQPARIALVMKSLANEFFINMAEGAKKHQSAHTEDYELIVNGIKNESDLAQQVALVEQMIASRVDAIVIAPADSKALLPVVKRAKDQGVVVINIDNKFDRGVIDQMGIEIPFVGPDNREGARLVGDHLAGQLNRLDKVAIIGGISGAFNAQQREQGFQEAMAAASINVVSVQAGDWEQSKAAAIASALLSEHPDLKAILCANDSMALGAVAAVRQAGRSGEVRVVGFDNISAASQLVQSGELLATADQFGDQLAVFGIEYALQILNEQTSPGDRKTPIELVVAD